MTRSLWKYVPAWLLAAVLWGLVAGCGMVYDDYPEDYDPTDPLVLVLRVAPVAQSRADDGKERMETLRIVLLDTDGKVEYNEMFSSSGSSGGDAGLTAEEGFSGDGGSFFKLIPTTPGDKKIFLIANEASVENVNGDADASLTSLLADYPKGSSGFEDRVNGIWFAPTYDRKIPLTSSYAFTLTQSSGRAPMDFYLVHAATKFEFTFENYLSEALSIEDLKVSSVADNMYLMAHFETEDEVPVAAETMKVAWDYPGKTDNDIWIDWLRKVCEDTTDNPDDPENENVNTRYGWITNYVLPNRVSSHTKALSIVNAQDGKKISEFKDNTVGSLTLPVVYCPESKNLAIPGNADSQEYLFEVTLKDEKGNSKTFKRFLTNFNDTEDNVLEPGKGNPENLHTLFRNTHVKVTARVTQTSKDIELTLLIGVCPWYEEEIDIPIFD